MSNRPMQEIVAEYNSLTGQNVKRFATVEIGEKRLALAKDSRPIPVPKAAKSVKPAKTVGDGGQKKRITVNGSPYRSVFAAFESLGLPVSRHIKFRGELNASGAETFEHEGKTYKFVKVKQGSI